MYMPTRWQAIITYKFHAARPNVAFPIQSFGLLLVSEFAYSPKLTGNTKRIGTTIYKYDLRPSGRGFCFCTHTAPLNVRHDTL